MIELLREGERVGYERLRQAVNRALELGAIEAEAVRFLIKADELERFAESANLAAFDETRLSSNLSRHFYRPLPQMTDYDGLLMNSAVPHQKTEVAR